LAQVPSAVATESTKTLHNFLVHDDGGFVKNFLESLKIVTRLLQNDQLGPTSLRLFDHSKWWKDIQSFFFNSFIIYIIHIAGTPVSRNSALV